MSYRRYKYCIVPMCRSTSSSTPNKAFINVPHKMFERRKWCLAMKRCEKKNGRLSEKSTRHVCEDHFDLEKDTENFMRYKLQGVRIRMKKGILPHLFKCQKEMKVAASTERATKRQRIRIVKDLLSDPPSTSTTTPFLQQSICSDEAKSTEDKATQIEKDVENCMRFEMVERRLQLKELVLPHIFACPIEGKASESTNSLVKGQKKDLVKETSACLKSGFLEPKVVIKEEPIDNSEDPMSSRLDPESILPCTDSYESCSTPAIQEAFTVVKIEPVKALHHFTSNDRTVKRNRNKPAKKADVEQSESRSTQKVIANSKTDHFKDSFVAYGEYVAAKPSVCLESSFLEPKVIIKEEPIDKADPISSKLHQESILPCTDSYHSRYTLAIKQAFTVVKTEPVEETYLITSNDRAAK